MAISFVNSATAFAESAGTTIVITQPTNTAINDIMIAAICVRPNTATITPPTGWALVRSQAQTVATAHLLIMYRKKVDTPDVGAANYTFTLGATPAGGVGGICTYRGCDLDQPIHLTNSVAASSGTVNSLTGDVTTLIANTMVVTAHAVANRDTWAPPGALGGDAAMTERVDNRPATANICLAMCDVPHAAASATGSKSATDEGPDAVDVPTGMILTLRENLGGSSPDDRFRHRPSVFVFDGGAGLVGTQRSGWPEDAQDFAWRDTVADDQTRGL